ncbi:hypothetical protein GA0070563_104392 [Micromonospora carbonacea]|uniref:Uncharacterized protein n=1 Tax=Micromonospora carbonacea TaxID=47853 RepID=A0A1C4XCM8_9ACTN|nr:hypothetical protein GA0070563_104392 [Micromonospora carbonacea]
MTIAQWLRQHVTKLHMAPNPNSLAQLFTPCVTELDASNIGTTHLFEGNITASDLLFQRADDATLLCSRR